MKLICEVTSVSEAKKLLKYEGVEGLIVGIDFLSLDINELVISDIEKIVNLCKKSQKLLFINATRIFHEDDLAYIKIILRNSVFKYIDYYLYSDLGFYQILVEKGMSDKAVYIAPTYLTNTSDINIFNKLNGYVVVSNQISSEELKEILNHVTKQVIVQAFGMACCFYSRRELVTNYFKFKNKKPLNFRGKLGNLQEETRESEYHLVEDINGVRIFEEKHYYLAEELDDMINISSLLISHFDIKNKDYLKIVSLYSDYVTKHLDSSILNDELNKLGIPLYKGAYQNKTVLLKAGVKNE